MARATFAPTPWDALQQAEPFAFRLRRKAVEPDHVLAHMRVDLQGEALPRGGQRRERAGRAMHEIADAGDVEDDEIDALAVDGSGELTDHGAGSGHEAGARRGSADQRSLHGRGAAMVGVRDGDRQRIGGIR